MVLIVKMHTSPRRHLSHGRRFATSGGWCGSTNPKPSLSSTCRRLTKIPGIPYWYPEEGSSLQCGKLKVITSVIHLDHHNFELTKLIITHQDGGSLYVNHFAYKNWRKDYILPRTSDFIDFLRMISLYRHSTVTPTILKGYMSPMVVHCSDVLERSMTF